MQKSFGSRHSGSRYDEQFDSILNHGKFYYPAWKHYEKRVTVICDRCKSNDLSACIGLGCSDLCMMCVSELTRRPSYYHSPVTNDHDYGLDDEFLTRKSSY
jgi:hypothetical protein